MTERSQAEEHLRVIRSLMEKATIYRAISAEAAAFGGVLALLVSFAHGSWISAGNATLRTEAQNHLLLTVTWLAALLITGVANIIFLQRHASRRGDPVFSPGMRLALVALAPSFVLAGALTLFLGSTSFQMLVPFWISLYGVGLLSTNHFAPRSLVWLGWAFVLAGIVTLSRAVGSSSEDPGSGVSGAQAAMALTFGLFHLIYAACTWPRKAVAPELEQA